LLVPLIAIRYGWRWAFIVTGLLGFIWLLSWLRTYRSPAPHSDISPSDASQSGTPQSGVSPSGSPQSEALPSGTPHSDVSQAGAPHSMAAHATWTSILLQKETLIICGARFLTDPVWWFLLYWLPKFLEKKYHITLTDIGLPLIIIYVAADLGGIAGGWLSSFFIKKGNSVDRSRKIAMLACAVCAVPVAFIAQSPGLWWSVAFISFASAAHQGWAANIYTLVSDIFPKQEVATVVGISTTAAVIGSVLASTGIGWALEKTGSYGLIFSIAGCMYVTAWVIIRIGIPVIKRV